ncbi:MAG: hypothetical protein AB7N91_09835 [Candidatus Tectimicrobiota bacterium]
MPPLAPDGESARFSPAFQHTAPDDMQSYLHARLQALELQITREQQRQQNHVEEELHKLRDHLATLVREQRQQQQALLANLREAVEELRHEVGEALYRLSQDMERVAQQAEAQANRTMERLRNELLDLLLARDQTTVKRHMLGELLVTLGQQLHTTGEESAP